MMDATNHHADEPQQDAGAGSSYYSFLSSFSFYDKDDTATSGMVFIETLYTSLKGSNTAQCFGTISVLCSFLIVVAYIWGSPNDLLPPFTIDIS